MKHCADSSFLVSCYLADASTARAKAWLLSANASLPFTDLHALEVPNALRLGVFRKIISQREATAAQADVESDLVAGRLVEVQTDWPSVFRVAIRLSEQNSTTIGSRSLDILHVAAAKTLRAAEFVSFDARQRTLAACAGLRVFP